MLAGPPKQRVLLPTPTRVPMPIPVPISMPMPMPILLGEPDPLDRTRLERILADWGYAVECFADGGAVLERLLMPDAPGIALLDFDLPGTRCLEICQALRASQPTPSAHRSRRFSPWVIGMHGGIRGGMYGGMWEDCDHPGPAGITANEVGWILQAGVCDILAKPVEEIELRLRLNAAQHVRALREELEQTAEADGFAASHDPLTGLWNREAFLSLLYQETVRAQRTGSSLALIAIDVDRFTQCNLELGYSTGDSILEQLAVRLRCCLRGYDILGRGGEDEFLAALPGCDLEDAIAMAERLRVEVMHEPFQVKTASLTVRASFGVAQSRGRSPLLVLREAETALADAKRSGRDRVQRYGLELLAGGGPYVARLGGEGAQLTSRSRCAP